MTVMITLPNFIILQIQISEPSFTMITPKIGKFYKLTALRSVQQPGSYLGQVLNIVTVGTRTHTEVTA